jgi:hypothetical protein
MGVSFWLLFVLQLVVAYVFYKKIFKVENERPTESITPSTDNEVEVL